MFNPDNFSYTLGDKEIKLFDLSQQDVAIFTESDRLNLIAGLYSYYELLVKEDDQRSLNRYRSDLVDAIWELAGDEYDGDGLHSLAKTTDYWLINSLDLAIEYIMENAEEYV